jgi:hypothetical protein
MSKRRRNLRRSNQFYKHAINIIRHGFFDSDLEKKSGKLADGFNAKDGFDLRYIKDWSPAQKAKVTKMFAAIDELTSRPFKVVKPRRKDHLERLQKTSQHERKIKGLKVAFVPVADPSDKIKITYTKTAVKIKERNVGKWNIELDKKKLLIDPETEINKKIAANSARVYNVMAGKFFIPKPLFSAAEVTAEVIKRQEKYNADDYDENDPNSSYWGNWLGGLIAYDYENRLDGIDFRTARTRFKELTFKPTRKSQRRKVMKLVKQRRKQRDRMRGK